MHHLGFLDISIFTSKVKFGYIVKPWNWLSLDRGICCPYGLQIMDGAKCANDY